MRCLDLKIEILNLKSFYKYPHWYKLKIDGLGSTVDLMSKKRNCREIQSLD